MDEGWINKGLVEDGWDESKAGEEEEVKVLEVVEDEEMEEEAVDDNDRGDALVGAAGVEEEEMSTAALHTKEASTSL